MHDLFHKFGNHTFPLQSLKIKLTIHPNKFTNKFSTGETEVTPDQVKARFRQRGETISQWARDQGYKPNKVIRVLNGFDKGHRGDAHVIAVKLGLKPDPNKAPA